MRTHAHATLLARLGADPETRTTDSDKTICHLRVAADHRVKDSDGNWGNAADWFDVVIFGRDAEFVGQHARKGDAVHVSGRLQIRQWTDREGLPRQSVEIVADFVGLVSSREPAPKSEPPSDDVPF